ncbi:MAG: ATP-binding protein [Kofleriaceae bacterium]
MRRGWISIRTKLIAFIAIPIVAIVVAFTWYFTSRQLSERSRFEDLELDSYGDQFGLELRSVVAFAERATAREVLGPVTDDKDVISTTLFDGHGDVLYQSGKPAPWIDRAKVGVVAKRLVHGDGRSSVIVPVISREGPRGTFVLEISTQTRFTEERRLVASSVGAALVALLFGVLAAWLIARSIARRLRAIATAATTADIHATVVDSGTDEIGVLATAFNDMFSRLRDDRARLTDAVLDLQSTEDQLAAANHELEQRVALRTSQLEAEMKRRGAMELELRQAQKLESVGRLAAGIAHEINSPVQFVSHSCTFLDEASESLIELVRTRRRLVEAASRGEITMDMLVAKLRTVDEACDVDHLISSMPDASKLVLQGLDRVTAIVRAMKEFAYADHPSQTASDLNRAIQNTLTVTSNEYKYVADTRLELGTLPPVMCHLGEINQAVLNIIVNAAHAIEDAHRGRGTRGLISISTRVEVPDAVVTITDNGCGIPAEVVEKIFDPFFTTKEIGRGSGQGLAIARAVIVDKHHGRLDVATRVGQGTTFTIRLPIAGLQVRAMAA